MLEQIKNKNLYVDADIYKYRCAAAAEKTKYCVTWATEVDFYESHKEAKARAEELGDGVIWSRKEDSGLDFALAACKAAIDTLVGDLEPKSVSLFLSPERNFRNDIARTKPYKGNRSSTPKPKYLKQVEEYLVNEYDAKYGDNVEADDLIGIALSNDRDLGVSVSIDKDLLQIPGWHYDWVNNRVRRVSPREADFNFYTQMLTGDATDNIPGIDGVGPRKAEQLLDGAVSREDLASRVWSVYRSKFANTEDARLLYLEQASLLWILRESVGGKGYQLPTGFRLE